MIILLILAAVCAGACLVWAGCYGDSIKWGDPPSLIRESRNKALIYACLSLVALVAALW